jgi:putative endonuclease
MSRMHEGSYFTYVMASRSRTLYMGMTGDLRQRVLQHRWREHAGFTARYNCDRLIWFERHRDVRRAIDREKELKGWKRAGKIALIESVNPSWSDLSRGCYDYQPADYRRSLDRADA